MEGPVLITTRLELRPLAESDLHWFVAMYEDPDVAEFVGAYPTNRSRDRIEIDGNEWAARGYGVFKAHLLGSKEGVGRFGLHWWDTFEEVEVGWTLRRPYWGMGYATEAATAVLDWAFKQRNLPEVTAMIAIGNYRSAAVARRLGFVEYRRRKMYDQDVTVFSLTANRWWLRAKQERQ